MEKDTVFIIGAGASKEANLPTGYELKGIIANLLDMRFDWSEQKHGDHLIANSLRAHVKKHDGNDNINPYLKEAWHIRDALSQATSIDNFIDSQKGNDALVLCGKLSIVRSILLSEKKSLLFFKKDSANSAINFNNIEQTWYIPFFQIITENCSVSELEARLKKVTLIIFNYDRCVEHFLFHAFINYYRISEQESAELVKNISIYHPYGKVGHLDWQDRNSATEFGGDINAEVLLYLSEKIKTFTEGTDPESSDIIEIRRKVENAHRVVFMGFAFHKLNMGLLKPAVIIRKDISNIKCFATTLGISNSDKEVITEQISELYKMNITTNMANVTCHNLFTEYWRSLSF
jgi:hypothetical protein